MFTRAVNVRGTYSESQAAHRCIAAHNFVLPEFLYIEHLRGLAFYEFRKPFLTPISTAIAPALCGDIYGSRPFSFDVTTRHVPQQSRRSATNAKRG